MIEYNKEIIKDFILEGSPSIKRESIEFVKIYDVGDGVWIEKYIVVDYCILTIREIYGVKKEFTNCKRFDVFFGDARYQKIKGLGL